MAYNFDRELAQFVELLPSSDFSDPVSVRAGMTEMMARINKGLNEQGVQIDEQAIAGLQGDPDIKLRLYRPDSVAGQPLPALLYIHGGGFVIGDLDSEHGSALDIARELGALVVSVDYRLAPEHPYPAGLNDCYAALNWLSEQAVALNVDRGCIALFGQSAGGGLSAALALMARDRGGPSLCFQFLGMPELDDRLQTPSMQSFDDTPLWDNKKAALSWQYYLAKGRLGEGYRPGADDVPALAAPARAHDLSGLPPAYISAMEFDPLRDEAVHYALKLMAAGVPVELHTFPGTFHGSQMLASAEVSQRQRTEMLAVLRRGIATPAP